MLPEFHDNRAHDRPLAMTTPHSARNTVMALAQFAPDDPFPILKGDAEHRAMIEKNHERGHDPWLLSALEAT